MINESVKYFSRSGSSPGGRVNAVHGSWGRTARCSRQPCSRANTPLNEQSCKWIPSLFFMCVCVFIPLWTASCGAAEAISGKRHTWRIQVQGREDEPLTLWACGTACEIVVCQWLLSQLIIEFGMRSIVPERWSRFQLAAYWDTNLWQY